MREWRRGEMLRVGVVGMLACALGGCFAGGNYPMVPGRLVRVEAAQVEKDGKRLTTREWAAVVHGAAERKLPGDRAALTTEGLAPGGKVIDVWKHFGLKAGKVDDLFANWDGIEQTAAVASPPPKIEKGHVVRAAWAGFSDVEVPGADGVVMYGRLGVPEKGREIAGSYIVITHGLFGTLDGADMENHVQALRRAGHHVLAVEMRGHGETQCRHPEYAITFGLREVGDLAEVARWLKKRHGATRVGLVSFSLTGYESLLMAWLDGRAAVTGFGGEAFVAMPQRGQEPAYNGGMMVMSAPVGIVGLADRFEPRVSKFQAPVKGTFQGHVAERLKLYGEQAPPGYTMWDLAESEMWRAGLVTGDVEAARRQLIDFIDLARDDWWEGARRMENVRVPVLVLSSANDPLGTAQGIAELFGRVRNPNVGVILLKEGGHMGFSALSADYYYSLMVNFFDPRTGPGVWGASGTVRGKANDNKIKDQ